ncbi:hypothetical protein G210_2091 [Candida maltosa Xu316]|uniref:Altered inheritance of mitochondria protein 3 n=1 Tax=Candida maltosa (strain Xu316) TaxID=1245528 RepID=M3JYP1_CANMX|nr:hypothetical protein G210_2091 [Candida maltosa Xu316]
MSFWDNNKDTFKSAGKSTIRGISHGTKAVSKAGYRTYKKNEANRKGTEYNDPFPKDSKEGGEEEEEGTSASYTAKPLPSKEQLQSYQAPPKRNVGVHSIPKRGEASQYSRSSSASTVKSTTPQAPTSAQPQYQQPVQQPVQPQYQQPVQQPVQPQYQQPVQQPVQQVQPQYQQQYQPPAQPPAQPPTQQQYQPPTQQQYQQPTQQQYQTQVEPQVAQQYQSQVQPQVQQPPPYQVTPPQQNASYQTGVNQPPTSFQPPPVANNGPPQLPQRSVVPPSLPSRNSTASIQSVPSNHSLEQGQKPKTPLADPASFAPPPRRVDLPPLKQRSNSSVLSTPAGGASDPMATNNLRGESPPIKKQPPPKPKKLHQEQTQPSYTLPVQTNNGVSYANPPQPPRPVEEEEYTNPPKPPRPQNNVTPPMPPRTGQTPDSIEISNKKAPPPKPLKKSSTLEGPPPSYSITKPQEEVSSELNNIFQRMNLNKQNDDTVPTEESNSKPVPKPKPKPKPEIHPKPEISPQVSDSSFNSRSSIPPYQDLTPKKSATPPPVPPARNYMRAAAPAPPN